MKKLTLIGLVVALMALFAGPAAAQDEPTVSAAPVAAEGPNDVTVTGAGFTPGIALFALPCPDAAGDLEAVIGEGGAALCDTSQLTPVTAGDDGGFEIVASGWDVPADGLVFAVGDAGSTEAAANIVTVGDGAAAEEPAAEEAAEEPAADDADLANTGAETGVLVGLGAALLGLGVVSTRAGRRLGDR